MKMHTRSKLSHPGAKVRMRKHRQESGIPLKGRPLLKAADAPSMHPPAQSHRRIGSTQSIHPPL